MKKLSCLLSLLVIATCCMVAFGAPKKKIHTIPENAKIYIDGSLVGSGSYEVKFDKNTDYYQVKVEAPGYITRRYRLLKNNPNKTITYTLPVNEALKATVGYSAENDYSDGEMEGGGLANRWFDITCRKGLTADVIWQRLMSVAITYFENVEVRDKAAGWIKTRWRYTKFPNQVVRTRLEVRMSFVNEDEVSYRARLVSEIRDTEDGENSYRKFNYLLKTYEDVVSELETSVGSNM